MKYHPEPVEGGSEEGGSDHDASGEFSYVCKL